MASSLLVGGMLPPDPPASAILSSAPSASTILSSTGTPRTPGDTSGGERKMSTPLFIYKREPISSLSSPITDEIKGGERGTCSPLFDPKILTARLEKISHGLNMEFVNIPLVVKKVHEQMADKMTPREIYELAEDVACHLTSEHPDYGTLAARMAIETMQKQIMHRTFSETIQLMRRDLDKKTGETAPIISVKVYDFIMAHREVLDAAIIPERDFLYDRFGFKTLYLQSYLARIDTKVVESPQYFHMRIACGIHAEEKKEISDAGLIPALEPSSQYDLLGPDYRKGSAEKIKKDAAILNDILESYDLFSRLIYTHGSPTLFNSGSPRPQLSSCFLLSMKEDSISGIYSTLKDCAQISQNSGGIGLDVSNIRCAGSYIKGTRGYSNGLVPMLRNFNSTCRYVDQGGGKRKGAFGVYLQPWHGDIEAWMDLKLNHGLEDVRARDLFYGLWIPDLFMRRVEADGLWTLMCPNDCPGLVTTHSTEFDNLYEYYEKCGKGRKTIKARELWAVIMDRQQETGTPYMLYKDACNRKSNQKHLGTIRCSNLCTEIIQYTDPGEISVCNLASISLKRFVVNDEKGPQFQFAELVRVVKVVTRNLNKVIDINYYPVKEAENSNLRHRPIGIGVQGLAETFFLMRLSYDSDEARVLNVRIFETILFASYEASHELALVHGPYSSFRGSPASKGMLHPDMWFEGGPIDFAKLSDPLAELYKIYDPRFVVKGFGTNEKIKTFGALEPMWDWESLRKKIVAKGMRNSLLVAQMPTASSGQILGNTEGAEPIGSNLFVRRTLSGEYVVVNKYLVNDLLALNLWNTEMKNRIIYEDGSIQSVDCIPLKIRELYKTVWEIKQRHIIETSAERGIFCDQSQSMNIHIVDVNYQKLTSIHFYAWKKGLKTGMYYLRLKSASDAIKFTLDMTLFRNPKDQKELVLSSVPLKSTLFESNVLSLPDTLDSKKSNEIVQAPKVEDIEAKKFFDEQKLFCSLKNKEACIMCSS